MLLEDCTNNTDGVQVVIKGIWLWCYCHIGLKFLAFRSNSSYPAWSEYIDAVIDSKMAAGRPKHIQLKHKEWYFADLADMLWLIITCKKRKHKKNGL